jgi:hypothetical protein
MENGVSCSFNGLSEGVVGNLGGDWGWEKSGKKSLKKNSKLGWKIVGEEKDQDLVMRESYKSRSQ